jgi:hypothetical protein
VASEAVLIVSEEGPDSPQDLVDYAAAKARSCHVDPKDRDEEERTQRREMASLLARGLPT